MKALKGIFHNFLQLIDCPIRVTKLSTKLVDLIVTNNPHNMVKQAAVPSVKAIMILFCSLGKQTL